MPKSAEFVSLKPGRVLPDATSYVHLPSQRSELGYGTRPSDAARNRATLSRVRRRGHLENEFFGNHLGEPSSTQRFVDITLDNGARLAVVGSEVGYMGRNGVIIATELPKLEHDELVSRQDEVVDAKLPRNLDNNLRLVYAAALLGGLYASAEQATETQIPIVMQHATPDVSKPHRKFPRSIPLVHATFGNVDLRTFSHGVEKSPHLKAEQEAIDPDYNALMAITLHAHIIGALKETEFEGRNFEVRPRSVEPYGTEILLDMPSGGLTSENIRFVSTILDIQHDSYVEFYGEHGGNRPVQIVEDGVVYSRKSQPAAREYLLFDPNNVLRIIRSGIEFSHAGCFEAAGAALIRKPEFAPLDTPEEIGLFRRNASASIILAKEMVLAA